MQYTFLKLSWLEKKVRPKLHAEAKFHGKDNTPIKRNANGFVKGKCLWNELISGNERELITKMISKNMSIGTT